MKYFPACWTILKSLLKFPLGNLRCTNIEFKTAELRPKLCYEFHLASQGHAQRAPKQPVVGGGWVASGSFSWVGEWLVVVQRIGETFGGRLWQLASPAATNIKIENFVIFLFGKPAQRSHNSSWLWLLPPLSPARTENTSTFRLEHISVSASWQ